MSFEDDDNEDDLEFEKNGDFDINDFKISSGGLDMTSPEWQEYVLKQFQPNELYNGHPNVRGLNRIVQKLVGPIVGRDLTTVQSPNSQNGYCATVEYAIRVVGKNGVEYVAASVGDASRENCKYPFSLHLSPMAETRAEARAIRKLLNLFVASAEEVDVPKDQPEWLLKNNIVTDSQLNLINKWGKRTDVNLPKLLASKEIQKDKMSKDEAADIIKTLENYQREEVPSDLVGFEELT